MKNKVAVIGAGMTRFVRRAKETSGELAAAAVQMALEDAGLTIDDIDCVVLGTAPDAFDGVHMCGEHLIAGSGGANKPYMRHYVGGGTGVMSPIHGWMHIASGKFKTCLVVAEEKMSPCNPHPAGAFLTIFDHTTEQPLKLTLIHIFALEMARFMHTYGYTEEEIAQISVLCKKNALDHPAAQVAKEITVKDVMESKLLSWPVKRYDISPTSDGAVALVLANERVARTHCKHPVFIEGIGYRLDTAYWCTRDLAFPTYVAMAAKDAYEMAGITNPADQIDIWEPYDPFDYKALHHLNALMLDKSGKKVKDLLFSGAFERDGSHPLCPSGGALGVGNPIAATGLMKIAELYFQLSGQAGKRQIQRPIYRGIAQAWGDLMQVGTVVIMSSEGSTPRVSAWSQRTAEDLPGTPLKSFDETEHVHYEPKIQYAWDNGLALTTYLDGFKKGKIRASHCSSCGRVMIPARSFCELCNLQEVTEYLDLPDTGTVQTFTISHVDWDSSPLPDGQVNIFAVVAIDGASPEMGLVHKLGEVDPKDVKIGMKVKAVWKPEEEREGSVTDLLYFRPLKKGEKASDTISSINLVELNSVTAKAFPGEIPLKYIYTAGQGGELFYQGLKKGKLYGAWCESCGTVHLPPLPFCDRSMSWIDLSKNKRELENIGRLISLTVAHFDRSGAPLEDPVVIGQVAFNGSEDTLFGRVDVHPDDVYLWMPVRIKLDGKVDPSAIVFEPLEVFDSDDEHHHHH